MLKVFIYLLLFLLPTQLGKHFWFDFSYKLGQRVDYLSPTIYFTDLLIFLILIVYVIKKRNFQPKAGQPLAEKIKNLPIFLIIITSFFLYWILVIKENPYLLSYNLIKLIEFVLLGYIIARTFKKTDFPHIIKVLNLSLAIQVFLALYQVIVEKSAGLWIIGERQFSISTPGIAKFVALGGHQLLRGYGTFPHPNVLAGFCLLLLVANRKNLIGSFLALLGILLSFSLLAWGLALVFLAYRYLRSPKLLMILPLLLVFFRGESVSRRIALLSIAWELFKKSPIFGVGLGNFIPSMPNQAFDKIYFWQPVHNIFVLVAAETGIIGLFLLIYLVWKFFPRSKILVGWWLVILITGLFDHYWLTLQQGRLMLVLVAGLTVGYNRKS